MFDVKNLITQTKEIKLDDSEKGVYIDSIMK